jgi:hypothetical protein
MKILPIFISLLLILAEVKLKSDGLLPKICPIASHSLFSHIYWVISKYNRHRHMMFDMQKRFILLFSTFYRACFLNNMSIYSKITIFIDWKVSFSTFTVYHLSKPIGKNTTYYYRKLLFYEFISHVYLVKYNKTVFKTKCIMLNCLVRPEADIKNAGQFANRILSVLSMLFFFSNEQKWFVWICYC